MEGCLDRSHEMMMKTKLVCFLREGRSNAHVKGDYQRIGDVMLRNMCSLKVAMLYKLYFSV